MKKFRIIFAAFFLVTFVASNAFGSFISAAPGRVEPSRLRWKDNSISIAISSSLVESSTNIKAGSDVTGAILKSIQAWQKVAAVEILIQSSDEQSVSPSEVGDGVSLITIAQTPENVVLFSKDPQAESAKTRVFYNRKGFITEADIVLSPFLQFSTDGSFGTFDLEATLTHEIGHLLGLRHSGVLGSTMSNSILMNGELGIAGLTTRQLTSSDIASIRDLYGVPDESQICCAALTGKLTNLSPRPFKNLRIWAEDARTGQVAAQTSAGADGSFKIGGLEAGRYSVFWQRDDDAFPSSVGNIGAVNLAKDEVRVLNKSISVGRSDMVLSYVGINGQLSDSAVTVEPGREYSFNLGGRNLDAKKLAIEFNSPFFSVSRETLTRRDFGQDVSVVNFVLTVHADVPRGIYSIFATGADGTMGSLIGALNVQ